MAAWLATCVGAGRLTERAGAAAGFDAATWVVCLTVLVVTVFVVGVLVSAAGKVLVSMVVGAVVSGAGDGVGAGVGVTTGAGSVVTG